MDLAHIEEGEEWGSRTDDEGSGPMRVRDSEPEKGAGHVREAQPMPTTRQKKLAVIEAGSDDDEDADSVGSMGDDTETGRTLSVAALERIQVASRSFRGLSTGISDISSTSVSASPGVRPQRPSIRRSSSMSQGQGSGAFSFVSEGSVGALVTVGEFTSNLSRKSEYVRLSIAKHSGEALALLKGQFIPGDGDIIADDESGNTKKGDRRYYIGDPVLISSDHARWAHCVNRHGYPQGSGTTPEEKQGPYIYVLGKVKTVHYEENAVFYTLTRADNGLEIRGDPAGKNNNMEPILTKAGEEAAQRAASETHDRITYEDEDEDEDENHSADNNNERAFQILKFVLEVLLLPLFLLYSLFLAVIGARLFRWAEAVFWFTKGQAKAFLNGRSPYRFSTTITTVNIIVLCSIWYMFIDQARLAFFRPSSDHQLAVMNFFVWSILTVELIFAVFIRPDDYSDLIQSEKAFMPTTARFISGFHLTVEAISLAFFVPEFLCLFHSDMTCDERPDFSLTHATVLAISGPTIWKSIAGRAFYACIRLRIFGLVRLWKNMWLKSKYIKRQRQGNRSSQYWAIASDATDREKDDEETVMRLNEMHLEEKQRNDALINASNIGTALMVTNSYRALAILVTIVGLFPMITLISFSAVTNTVTTDMVGQLQATNLIVTTENEMNCEFLVGSVEAWARSWFPRDQSLITSDTDNFLVALVVQPARCREGIEALEVGDLRFFQTPCSKLEGQYRIEHEDSQSECILGVLQGTEGGDLWSIAHNFELREGNLVIEHSPKARRTLISENGTSSETSFQISACFNQTYGVESSALASCIAQFCLLMTVLGGLSVLRRDAAGLVLGPLRSMLKIVARYARNPLAQTGAEFSKVNRGDESDSDFSDPSAAAEVQGTGFGTYETEQLITAVAKITDLLRKCWGVAGADIISTNLASREGTLSEVFNPTVPGKSVYALFAFAAINGFDHALKCLGGDVMILINDVARVLHDEVYRWGFGDSGQCNKNLGAAFLMVFRIGLVKEVVEKLEEATKVVFSSSDSKKQLQKKNRLAPAQLRSDPSKPTFWGRQGNSSRSTAPIIRSKTSVVQDHDTVTDAMQLSLQSLPGISTFTDRAVVGMLKSFAGIHRDYKLMGWARDFRLSPGANTFEVNMIFGMDAGWAVEGAVGSEYKIDATYLSPHVNMASRMMSACKHYGVTILLSEAVQELMSDTAKRKLRNVDRVTVKGSVRIQKIFTYDARHKGADFFLFSRSDEAADADAEQYVPSIWTTDQDLQAMRHHVTDDFESEFNAGLKAYYAGDWPTAIQKLESANEIMVDAAMEEGYLHDEMDNTPSRKELYRKETADGPCSYLVNFMKSKGGVAPEDWDGWHPLLSK